MDINYNSSSEDENESALESNSYISENEIKIEYRKAGIFERLLKEEKNLKYKILINNNKNNKIWFKKHTLDDDEIEEFKNSIKNKKKFKYPKQLNLFLHKAN